MTLLQDVSFACRQILRHRVYSITAVISMALGIGATAAVYSVLYGVLIDPYPYRDPDRIAFITIQSKSAGGNSLPLTIEEADQLRQRKPIEDVLQNDDESMVATDGDIPQSVKVLRVPGGGLQFLGAPPMMGRIFTASEAREGVDPPPVAVISYLFWKSHFASDPRVLGKTVELDQHRYTVVGVMGPRFTWRDSEVYLPMVPSTDPKLRLETLIRLRPGVSTQAAAGDMTSFVQQLAHYDPTLLPQDSYSVKIETLNDWLLGQFKGTLLVLFGAVALLLLIGCGNVSILMLVRGTARMQELATRLAVGASRWRVVRQLLTEAVILSVTGGILGMALAYGAIHLIVGLLPEYSIPHEVVIHINVPVLLFSTGVSVVVGILAGLSPALQFSSPHISQMVQSSGSRSTTSRGGRTRMVLIMGQIALTVLMLAGAGAAMRNFVRAYTAHLGMDPHHMLMLTLHTPEKINRNWQNGVAYQDHMLEKVRAIPGVLTVSEVLTGAPPLGGWRQPVQIIGGTADTGQQNIVGLVDSDFFVALRIPILAGRTPTHEEVLHGDHVACVSRAFADRYFGGTNPIGRLVVPAAFSKLPPLLVAAPNLNSPFRIVGVVGDVLNDGLHRPALPEVYVPSSMILAGGTTILVRTTGDPMALSHAVSMAIHSLNQNRAVARVISLDEFCSMFAWSHERFIAALFGVFSLVALGLAATGISSVVAYGVEQRTREFGIRMALGAQQRHVLLMTVASTARTAGMGVVLGILLSVFLSNWVQRWTESSMRDTSVLSAISLVFLLASSTACIFPVRRATRIDPMIALRDN